MKITKKSDLTHSQTIKDFLCSNEKGDIICLIRYDQPYLLSYKSNVDGVFSEYNIFKDANNYFANGIFSTAFSPDGNYFAVSHVNYPYLTLYVKEGELYKKITTANTVSRGGLIGFSRDNKFLVVRSNLNPYLEIFSVTGSNLTRVSSLTHSMYNSGTVGPVFSKIGDVVATFDDVDYIVNIFKTSVGTPYRLNAFYATSRPLSAEFSEDGEFLALGLYSYPFLEVYKKGPDSKYSTKYLDPLGLPVKAVVSCIFLGKENIVVAKDSSGNFTYFKCNTVNNRLESISKPEEFPTIHTTKKMKFSGERKRMFAYTTYDTIKVSVYDITYDTCFVLAKTNTGKILNLQNSEWTETSLNVSDVDTSNVNVATVFENNGATLEKINSLSTQNMNKLKQNYSGVEFLILKTL